MPRIRPQGAAQDCWRNRHWQRRSSRLPARGSATPTVGERGGSWGIQGKAAYCTDCHGASGRGYRGFYVMPRLAGQSPEYLQNQLRAFVAGRRGRHSAMVMSKVHGLGPAHAIGTGSAFCRAQPSTLRRRLRGSSSRQDDRSTRRACPKPTCRLAPSATVRTPRVTGQFLVWPGQLYAYTVKELANWDEYAGSEAGRRQTPQA